MREIYRRTIPFGVRKTVWNFRDALFRLPEYPARLRGYAARLANAIRRFSGESQKHFNYFGRYLSFRLTGRCNACRGTKIVRYRNPSVDRLAFSFYECQGCGFIFVAPLPDISSHYVGQTMPEFGEGEGTWNKHYMDSIEKYAEHRGKLLEIGFGNASFLKLARERGWETYGAELSVGLAAHARDVLKLPNIALGTIDELGYPENFFDVVAGFNFLEHVCDPREMLKSIRRILRPAGIVAVMCPNIAGIFHSLMPEILADNDPLKISWCPPDHLSYFNKTNLRILMEDVGFTVVGDESHLMNSLWRQFEVKIGPQPTGEKLKELISKIRSFPGKGNAKVEEFRGEIKDLVVERMTWAMISDLIELEPLIGADVGILMLGRKSG
jgi:ubiquinone/menaquinone biosynthesis C-methylase UbiE